MKLIAIGPELFMFHTAKEFIDEFKIGKDDLIVTIEVIYNQYFKEAAKEAHVLFCDKYGSTEPTDEMLDAIIQDASAIPYKRIIGIGGGAVMDMAKVVSVSDGMGIDAIFDKLPNLKRKAGLVLIPTTCGTGSEVTQLASINRTRLGTKVGMGCPDMYADTSVLIPELLYGLPNYVFATSSIDALVHAVESVLSPNATPYTKLFGYQAIEMIIKGYQEVEKGGVEARNRIMGDFCIASNYAGISFGTSGCAAVHALSYQLGGKYHVPHGESNYAMFTGVLKNYAEIRTDGELAVLNKKLTELLGCPEDKVYDELEELLNKQLPKKALHEYGVTEDDLPRFARTVMETQERLMKNNFVPLDEARVLKIFQELY